jgi:hypothetical protein
MAVKTSLRLTLVLFAVALTTRSQTLSAAEPPSPAQALALAPTQPLVEYTIPSKEDVPRCTVRREDENNVTSWVVRSPQGEMLRRFSDTNGDNVVDLWCYFLGGLEVYRDIDSNYNGKADQYRWFNTAGTRWAIDKNEDGKIDYWNAISPHEVAEQVVLALKTRDQARFDLLVLTPTELNNLGFGQTRKNSIAESTKNAATTFSKIAGDQKQVTAQTRYVDFGSARPATIPSGTAGSTKDVTICDNATALIQTNDKHEQISLGTLVAVGNSWKLVDAPDFDNRQVASGFLTPSASSTGAGASGDAPSDKMQKLMADLEKIDKEADSPETIDKRVTILQSLAEVTPEKDRDQWYRQLADVLSVAIQTNSYPQGAQRLQDLQKTLTDAKASQDVIAHAAFQLLWSQYVVSQHDPNADQGKLQEKWLADLKAFVGQFANCSDTAEALFQLGLYEDLMGKSNDAAEWYKQIVTNFPNAGPAEKAKGALRRLGSVGKPMTLRGNDLQGGTVDIARYRSKVVLIHYWTTLGGAWQNDLVLLRDFYAKKGGKDFDIVGVYLGDKPDIAKQYIAQNKIPWKQIYEPGELDCRLANEMGILTLPLMILVDQKGNVANHNIHVPDLDPELARLMKPDGDTANALRSSTTPR